MASMTPISPPFLPISYLCAVVSIFGNRLFCVIQHLGITAQWQLMPISITCPDR